MACTEAEVTEGVAGGAQTHIRAEASGEAEWGVGPPTCSLLGPLMQLRTATTQLAYVLGSLHMMQLALSACQTMDLAAIRHFIPLVGT